MQSLIPYNEAIELLLNQIFCLEPEIIHLPQGLDRILGEDIYADIDLPPFDRAVMDGFAVRYQDVQVLPSRLRVIGDANAGEIFAGTMKEGEAVRIMTGAPIPEGANTVQMVEKTLSESMEQVESEHRPDMVVGMSASVRGEFYSTTAFL